MGFEKSILLRLSALFLTISGTATPIPALAQTTDGELQPVVVTASRRTQTVQDVPYNISALTGNALIAKGVTSVTDLMQDEPGILFVNKGPATSLANPSGNLTIRGINADAVNQVSGPAATAPTVSTYINDVPVFVDLRLTDIERVEVLRGPQGTLYGSSALGGTVRYLYNNPAINELSGNVTGDLSSTIHASNPNGHVDLMLNVPLGDQVALRISAGHQKSAGFIDAPAMYVLGANDAPVLANGATNPFTDANNFFAGQPVFESEKHINGSSTSDARVSLRWRPTDKFDSTVWYLYQKDDSDNPSYDSIYEPARDHLESPKLANSPAHRKVQIAALEAGYDLGFAKLIASASHYDIAGAFLNDMTGFYTSLGFYGPVYGSSPRFLAVDENSVDQTGTVGEVRLVSNKERPLKFFAGSLDWIVGLFYHHQHESLLESTYVPGYTDYSNSCYIHFGSYPGPFGVCGFGTVYGLPGYENVPKDLDFLADRWDDFLDRAVYGDLTWHVTNKWQITGGARAFSQKIATTTLAGLPDSYGMPAPIMAEKSANNAIFMVNTSYKLTRDMMIYAVWSQGFRRGGSNALPTAVGGQATDPGIQSFSPDKTDNEEVGLKGSFLDSRYLYSLDAFNVSWHNMQAATICTPRGLLCGVNAGEARSRGVEASLEGRLTDRLTASVSYSYDDAKLVSTSAAFQRWVAEGQLFFHIVQGTELPGAPKSTAYWDASYDQPLTEDLSLIFDGNGSYRGTFRDALVSEGGDVPSYVLWNASVALSSSANWTARLYINNVADARAFYDKQSAIVYGASASGYLAQPRTIGLNLSYSFRSAK